MNTNSPYSLQQLQKMKMELTRFMMAYEFALDQITTKIENLSQEFHYTHEYNPIEHVNSRLKSPESIFQKVLKRNLPLTLPAIEKNITDIAGVRIICSFQSDIYALKGMLERQEDVRIVEVKDYFKQPKSNGYQSLHLLLEVPVHMSSTSKKIIVEVQIRTIAMDFWASLEHKIYYKYNQAVPDRLRSELKEAADSASALDRKMEKLHLEMKEIKKTEREEEHPLELMLAHSRFSLPEGFLKAGESPEED
ncbi:GTP pyrophosphokinase [Alkalicoccus saliphilus]|uniref:GTP pyrophosphokinase n=1 Tax=Alkalicoccus saliphilus TaxID=200989 RepID=A0A2T4U5W5_9BACI|nr:GTP pyrophosphokinase family protein [Alkalicoccus saliphilus]PTL38798.1 GTP pyrophosphokinase [Alkalicoccus saliphilus]